MADMGGDKLKQLNPDHPNNCAPEWEDYKKLFKVHLDSNGLHDAPGRRKVGKLLECMGLDHIITYETFTWAPAVAGVEADEANGIEAVIAIPAENQHDLDTVLKKFDLHFGVHRYRSIKRQEFLSTQRGEKEGIMSFIAKLKSTARQCAYGDMEEDFICDMVINKIKDTKCTEKLMELSDDELTLDNVIRVCRQVELTRSHLETLDEEAVPVHHTRKQWQPKPQCPKCMRHHDPTWCRADSTTCSSCGMVGHFMKSKLCPLNSSTTQRGRGRGRGRGSGQVVGRGRGRWAPNQQVYHTDREDGGNEASAEDEQFDL